MPEPADLVERERGRLHPELYYLWRRITSVDPECGAAVARVLEQRLARHPDAPSEEQDEPTPTA